jgi:ABC-type polysaccharide/polyol phosphate export permease
VRVTVGARRVRLGDIWRSLPVGLMLGKATSRSVQSALGPLWLVLQPVGMLPLITIPFTKATSVNTAASHTSSRPGGANV